MLAAVRSCVRFVGETREKDSADLNGQRWGDVRRVWRSARFQDGQLNESNQDRGIVTF